MHSRKPLVIAFTVLVSSLIVVQFAAAQDPREPTDIGLDIEFDVELVAEGLTSPVHLAEAPDASGRLFVVDQIGVVHLIDADGTLVDEPFLDVRDRMIQIRETFDERGLLGLAFHPEFVENGRFFVNYSAPLRDGAPADWDHTTRVSEFKVDEDDPNRANPDSERIVIEVDQPRFNHNAGDIAFGPDGYLYIPLGDGGAGGDISPQHPPMGFAQDLHSLLGNILRIDVDRGWPTYAIPEDNPFVGDPRGLDEIYAWGFRNPFRISFDTAAPHHLFVADAGQWLWEYVHIVSRPGNYGWRIKEGTYWFDPEDFCLVLERGATTGPLGETLIDPVLEYPNMAESCEDGRPDDLEAVGVVIIGGHMYRGSEIPELYGKFVFGDWSRSWGFPAGVVLAADPAPGWSERWRDQKATHEPAGTWRYQELLELDSYLLSVERDAAGEIYLLTNENPAPVGDTGRVYRLVAANDDALEMD